MYILKTLTKAKAIQSSEPDVWNEPLIKPVVLLYKYFSSAFVCKGKICHL